MILSVMIFSIILKSLINVITPRHTEYLNILKGLLVENSTQISNVQINALCVCYQRRTFIRYDLEQTNKMFWN